MARGLHGVIPLELISIFNEAEFELLLAGLPTIDVEDWQRNTLYSGGYTADQLQIQWFWNVVKTRMKDTDRALLLKFATGTSTVPPVCDSIWLHCLSLSNHCHALCMCRAGLESCKDSMANNVLML
jgi:hypothetical protein